MSKTVKGAPVPGGGRQFDFAARILASVVVVSAVVWLFAVRDDSDMEATYDLSVIASHMLDGETFPAELLAKVEGYSVPAVEAKNCDFRGLQNLAILRVARVENAVHANDPDVADRLLKAAAEAAAKSLRCNPSSTVSWTILAWIEFIRNDDTPRLRALLNMSFRTGPYEGWALVRRSEMLLHILPALDDALTAQLRDQLNWLLAVGAVNVLAEQYGIGGPKQQDLLRAVLSEAVERDQKRAAELIRSNGGDIALPLVEPQGSRPWK